MTTTCAACASGERLLVQAFASGADRVDRIPLDQALCITGGSCELSLAAGSYDMVVWSETALIGVANVELGSTDSAAIAL